MALKVWLPLDGDLRNLGCSNVTVTNNGATVNANGKIGKCYEFGTNKYIKLIDYAADFLTYNEFSLSVWFKCTAQNTAHTGSALISGGNWNQANNLLQFSLGNFSTDHYTRLLISGSGDWARGYSYNFYLNTWYHVVLTSGNGKMRAYVNGQLIGDTYSAFKPASLEQTWICIGNGTYSQLFHFIGLMNDVRIYDHCLSAAEVKEIAQGLVLHYKLNGFMGGINDNLAQGSKLLATTSSVTNCNISKRGSPTVETRTDGFAQLKGTAAWQGFSLWSNSLNLKVGTTYTYSFYGYTALSTSTNAGISFYPMMYNSAGTRDTSSKMPISVMGDAFTNANARQIGKLSTTPQLYWASFTWNQTMADILTNGGKIELSIQIHSTFNTGRTDYLWAPKLEVGEKPTGWTPSIEEMGIDTTKIEDSSGYGHNGKIISELHTSNDTARYNSSTLFDGVDDCIIVPYNTVCPENIFTINLWFKKDAIGTKSYETLFGGPSGFEMDTRAASATSLSLYMASTRSGNRNSVTSLSLGNWYMVTMTRDGTKEKYYINGIFQSEIDAKSMPTGNYYIGAWQTTAKQNYYGLISDFRIYCTPLLDTDIKQLYNVGMKVDNLGGVHSYTFNETNENILFNVEKARTNLTFTDGLRGYTQSNCQVTLTEQGYHIYRPPNLTTANDGNTMWGGLLINNQTTRTIAAYDASRDNIWNLQKNHTYIFAFHAKGQSSNSPSLIVESNMGWDRIAGVGPNPTYLASKTIPTNFNGEQDCYIIFKIEDDIVKVATENKSSYVQGTSYLSYKELCLNYVYTATGTLGTDLYLTNFRLYDITDQVGQIKKTGIINFSSLVEQADKTQIRKNSELLATEFIEM